MTSRREFIGLAAGALAAAPLLSLASASGPAIPRAARPLSMLVLGGTGFLGPHQIEYAIARGHRVTMFNRGSNPGMFGDAVEELIGNRDSKHRHRPGRAGGRPDLGRRHRQLRLRAEARPRQREPAERSLWPLPLHFHGGRLRFRRQRRCFRSRPNWPSWRIRRSRKSRERPTDP